VTVKNKIWFKKALAAFLLLALFTVTVIQVSHSHAPGFVLAGQKKVSITKDGPAGYYKSSSESKCFICEYQLTKDADDSHFSLNIHCNTAFNSVALITYSFTSSDVYSVFKTRGPPQSI